MAFNFFLVLLGAWAVVENSYWLVFCHFVSFCSFTCLLLCPHIIWASISQTLQSSGWSKISWMFRSIQKLLKWCIYMALEICCTKIYVKFIGFSSCSEHDTIVFMQNWWRGDPSIFQSCRWWFYSLTFFTEENNSLEGDIQNSFQTRTWSVVKYGLLAWIWCAESTLPHCPSWLSVHQLAILW